MRILGLDYGSKRIGVAVSDELEITAQGLATITRRNQHSDLDEIAKIIRTYGVEKIIIGYPITLDGREGIQCEKISRFAKRLEAKLRVPVIKWDETLTTKEAEDILIQAQVRRDKRKLVVDKLAATLILQGYLDNLKRMSNPESA